jgi:hypothetical protein
MSAPAPSLRDRIETQWEAAKPVLMGLAIGLVTAPIISSFMGFQVRSSSAMAATRASVVEQQAAFCVERARAAAPLASATAGATPAPALDWQARTELARRFATMPGAAAADPEVVYACSSKLTT